MNKNADQAQLTLIFYQDGKRERSNSGEKHNSSPQCQCKMRSDCQAREKLWSFAVHKLRITKTNAQSSAAVQNPMFHRDKGHGQTRIQTSPSSPQVSECAVDHGNVTGLDVQPLHRGVLVTVMALLYCGQFASSY